MNTLAIVGPPVITCGRPSIVSIYFCPQQTRHHGAQEHIYIHDSVAEVDFLRREKLCRRDYLDYLKNRAKSGDMENLNSLLKF